MIMIGCGGRTYPKFREEFEIKRLDVLMKAHGVTEVFHGAATGADTEIGLWAKSRGLPVREFPADWNQYGRAAGPFRNGLMLEEALKTGQGVLVVAFPGGLGTQSMKTLARNSRIPLYTYAG